MNRPFDFVTNKNLKYVHIILQLLQKAQNDDFVPHNIITLKSWTFFKTLLDLVI